MRSAFLCLFVLSSLTSRDVKADDFELFEKKIRPIFLENCYKCHSADAEKLKGGLRLDNKEGILKGGESGPAIVPGDVEKSLIVKAVRYTDKDLQMPPKDKKLSAAQIADLEAWVKMGAPDPRTELVQSPKSKVQSPVSPYDFTAARTNWAFRRPRNSPIPKIKNKAWPKSPIDNFILAKLEEKKLSPAPPADKRTLIRRATFDLIGLPPSPKEISDFLADQSSDAFARVVERLLASPQYGERWGRHWLDVVRYTDSVDARVVGGAEDVAEIWRYRDWVVNAFNRDLPYDQFITQQIAGDLLPPPAPDGINTNAIIATGMYAVGAWGNGDADKEKILTDIADDAVDVTSRAFLGITMACARCHDHKFDPIPTADYYSLAGIFFSTHIIPKLAAKGAGESMLRIPLAPKAELEKREKDQARTVELDKAIEKAFDDEISALAKKSIPLTSRYLVAAFEFPNQTNKTLAAFAGERALREIVLARWVDFLGNAALGLFQNPVKNLSGNAGLLAWKNSKAEDTPWIIFNSSEKEFAKIPAHNLAVHPAPKTAVGVAWKSLVSGAVQLRGRIADADPNCGDGIDWSVARNEKELAKGSIPNGGMQSLTEGENTLKAIQVERGEMIQVTIFPKGDHVCDTTLVDLQIAELDGQKRVWNLTNDIANDFLGHNPHADVLGNSGVWHFIDLADEAKGFGGTNAHMAKLSALRQERFSEATVTEFKKIAEELQRSLDTTNAPKLLEDLTATHGALWSPVRKDERILSVETQNSFAIMKSELAELKKTLAIPILQANGLQEGGVPETPHAGTHDVKIHVRGRYDRLGETTPRRFPRILAGENQPAISEGSGRLQLANWIANPENPLTARVMVNRIWQHHFGEGIVRTPNNYGKLGEPPTHPELLDFLALEFMKSGWSIKAMHRAIMLSATYQLSSAASVAQASSRQVTKLPASSPKTSSRRDASKPAGWKPALQVDLENKLFGRANRRRLESESLRDSLLSVAGKMDLTLGGPSIRDLNTNRRTLYVMTIRSDRATFQFLFDAADPNTIVDKRLDSTVSPQALFLLNHPFALAQTKALAQRVSKLENSDDGKKLQWLYETLYGRLPSSQEIKIGGDALKQTRQEESDKTNSEELAWEEYCQVLLCANEFIYVD